MACTPARFLQLAVVVWCAVPALTTTACRSGGAHEGDGATPLREPATLRVLNANWSDVRIYLMHAGMALRLGSVSSQSSAVFEIPPDVLAEAAGVTLVASPLAGRESFSVALTGVQPGDQLELTVENQLSQSHFVVR